ncbi:hypothetical protein D3C86_2262700 [compost metagenome]
MQHEAISKQVTSTTLRENNRRPVRLKTQSINTPPAIKPRVPTNHGRAVTMLMDLRSMPLASIR